jgi:DNA invertase Pin-like site-specific DNA recombinase
MKAIVYRRVSGSKQANDEKDGLPRQTRLCEEHALRMGWEIAEYASDAGKSAFHGANLKGELGRIIAEAEAGRLKNTVIVAEKIDRLSRLRRAEGYAVIQRCVKAGLLVAIVDGSLLYNPNSTLADDIMLMVKLEVANEESQKKQDRTLSARQAVYEHALARTGKWTRAVPQPNGTPHS